MNRIAVVFVGAVVLTTIGLCAVAASSLMWGAVAGLGLWLVGAFVVLRRSTPTTSASSPAAGPYAPVLEVDPGVFDDPLATEGRGLEVFNAWARNAAGAPRNVSSLARGVRVSHPDVGRFVTTVEVRRFIWREQKSSAPATPARTSIERLDAWAAPTDLRQDTRSVVACGQCAGAARISCRRCAGRGRVPCDDCSGTGKSYQYAKNGSRRLMNCGSCSKTGQRSCGCAAGSVSCETCSGVGGFERWAEVETETRLRAEAFSSGGHALPFDWARDPTATRGAMKLDATFVDEIDRPRALTMGDVDTIGGAAALAAWQQQQERLPGGARITRQRLEMLQLPVVDVTWGLGSHERHVELFGRRMLAPPGASADLFAARARALRVSVIAGMSGIGAVVATTVARGPFFATSASYGSWLAAIVAVAFGVSWVHRATLAKQSARFAFASLVSVAAAFAGTACAAPQLDHVRELLNTKSFEAARQELTALDGIDSAAYPREWAALRLLDIERVDGGAARAGLAALIRSDLPEHSVAAAMVDAAYTAEARTQLAAGEPRTAKQSLAHLSGPARDAARPLAVAADVAIASDCECAGDWRCALEHATLVAEFDVAAGERARTSTLQSLRKAAMLATSDARARKDLVARDRATADAVVLWRTLSTQDPSAMPKLNEVLKLQADTSRAVSRQQEVERRKQAAIDARERARAEAEARREAAQERQREWWSSPLRCCDGSRSPTCTKGGSHRGCCSHHGGVCG